MIESGEEGFAGHLTAVAALFGTPAELLQIAARWIGPALYRSHTFEAVPMEDGRIRFRIALKPGLRPCKPWFQMTMGAIRVMPRFVRQADAAVEVESLGPTSASFLVTTTAERSARARLRQLWAAVRSPKALADELVFQQQQLLTTLDALRRSEGGFRAAFDALPALVALHHDGTLVYVNPALTQALGQSASRLRDARLIDLIHPADRAQLSAALEGQALEGALPPLRMLRASGETMFVEAWSLPPFDFAGRSARGLVAIDVSSRVRAEETNRLLMSSLPDLLAVVDREGRVKDVQAGREFSELAAALRGLIGMRAWDLPEFTSVVTAARVESARGAIEAALTSGQEQRVEFEVDERRAFEVRAMPREGGDEALVLVRDVTAQRRVDRQLAITERMAAVGTLAAGVAHEVNNPLTYLIANQELLAEGLSALSDGEEQDLGALRQLLDEAREGAQRVREIVASLRGFSRVEIAPSPVAIDCVQAFERAISLCGSELKHGATLERRLEPVPPVLGDESRLVQVLTNLLVNAVQASRGPASEHRVVVESRVDTLGRVLLSVHDSGQGMPPEVLKHAFDPFYTTKPRGRGTGLGLSISHRIVHDMGGKLLVTSEPGHGSCFTVLLSASGEDRTEGAVAGPEPELARVSVLLIDDDLLVARALAALLVRDGNRVTSVTNARAALQLLTRESFDVVLCDLMMPDLPGLELYHRACAADPSAHDRFVFITGGTFSEGTIQELERIQRPVLTKPPALVALRRTIAEVGAARGRA